MAAITKDEKISLEIFEVHQRQLWQGIAGNIRAEKNDTDGARVGIFETQVLAESFFQ